MKILKNWKLLLFLIIIIAAVLRFYKIDTVPPSMYWDEVSQGYNAYSILKTGRDEHQEFMPLARFQAFGDYKAPVYIYLDVPFIALFGKTTEAVRFPSALFGTITVLCTFFLVQELFYKDKRRNTLALISSFFLAISPWHNQLSRIAYEGNIATFFTILATLLFLVSIRKNIWILIFSVASFVLAFYAFNAHRIFIPLFVLLLGILYFKSLWIYKKVVILAGIFGIVLLIPYLLFFKSPESKLRFNEVNIFTDSEVVQKSNEWIHENSGNPLAHAIYNRRVLYTFSYIKHYFDFFNPTYLFISGDVNPRFSSRDVGELYLWELPFFLIGLYALSLKDRRVAILLFGWFLLAPVAAATARETPHALRSETFIPTYEIFIALAFVFCLDLLRKYKYAPSLFMAGFTCLVCLFMYVFLHNYYVHFPREFSGEFQYGYQQAVTKAEKNKNNYDYIVMTKSYGRPYIYTLFYSDITPQQFWGNSKVKRDTYGFYEVDQSGRYVFREKLEDQSDNGKRVLYIGKPTEIPEGLKIIDTVKFLKGDTAFELAGRE